MRPSDFDDEPLEPGLKINDPEATWRKYKGRVVALVDGEVKASGKDWGECLKAAKQAGLAKPTFMYFPDAAIVG